MATHKTQEIRVLDDAFLRRFGWILGSRSAVASRVALGCVLIAAAMLPRREQYAKRLRAAELLCLRPRSVRARANLLHMSRECESGSLFGHHHARRLLFTLDLVNAVHDLPRPGFGRPGHEPTVPRLAAGFMERFFNGLLPEGVSRRSEAASAVRMILEAAVPLDGPIEPSPEMQVALDQCLEWGEQVRWASDRSAVLVSVPTEPARRERLAELLYGKMWPLGRRYCWLRPVGREIDALGQPG